MGILHIIATSLAAAYDDGRLEGVLWPLLSAITTLGLCNPIQETRGIYCPPGFSMMGIWLAPWQR